MRIHIDDSELRNLEIDLRQAPGRMQRGAAKTLREAGVILNRGMREDAGGHRYLKHLPNAVSHELLDPWTLEVGLGPKRGTQGSLAHIIAYGSVNNAPVYDHTAALRRNTPRIVKMFGDEAEEATLGKGGGDHS